MTGEAVRRLLQAAADKLGSHERLAHELDMSRQMVSLVLSGERAPSTKMLDYLGIEKHRIVAYYWKRDAAPAATIPPPQRRTPPHARTPRG